MTKEDRLYFAGLMDGIGTFFANAKKGKVRAGVRRMYPQYGVEVVSTDKEFMNGLAEFMGGEARPKAQGKNRRTQSYVIRLYSENAVNFITELIPYLRLKKQRAELTRELHELVKKEPKTASDEKQIAQLMQQLAKRGKPGESAQARGAQPPAPGKMPERRAAPAPASGKSPQEHQAPARPSTVGPKKLSDEEFKRYLKMRVIPPDHLLTEEQKEVLAARQAERRAAAPSRGGPNAESKGKDEGRRAARKAAGTSRRGGHEPSEEEKERALEAYRRAAGTSRRGGK